MFNEWNHSQTYFNMRPYNHHSPETDKILVEVIEGRGNNSKTTAAAKARQVIFKKTKQKYSSQSLLQRYYKIRNESDVAVPVETPTKDEDVRKLITDMLMRKENITIEIQGKQVTAVFK